MHFDDWGRVRFARPPLCLLCWRKGFPPLHQCASTVAAADFERPESVSFFDRVKPVPISGGTAMEGYSLRSTRVDIYKTFNERRRKRRMESIYYQPTAEDWAELRVFLERRYRDSGTKLNVPEVSVACVNYKTKQGYPLNWVRMQHIRDCAATFFFTCEEERESETC